MAYEYERDEWRNALRHSSNLPCLNHDMQPNLLGGGTCTHCGEDVDREEL